jgi:phage terminase large subunit-like protein
MPESVVDGRTVACQWVRLACERQIRDLATFKGDSSPFYYDPEAGNRVCDIIQRFPHIKGIWAQHRKKIELEPWQCFIICTVFGWMCTATRTRRFRVAYVEVPRKNAKSTLTSALGNYLVACDNEEGAYVSVRPTPAIRPSWFQRLATDGAARGRFPSKFGVEVMAHTIVQPETASKFRA